MSKLQGVFWDLDGTIANTEFEAHLPAFNNAFNDLKIGWFWNADTYVDLLKVNGGKNRIAHYSEINNFYITSDLVIRIHERKQYHYLNNIRNNSVSLKSGVYRLIKNLNELKESIVKDLQRYTPVEEVDIEDVDSVPLKDNASEISFDNFEKENASEKNRKKISVTESDIKKLIENNRKEMLEKKSDESDISSDGTELENLEDSPSED